MNLTRYSQDAARAEESLHLDPTGTSPPSGAVEPKVTSGSEVLPAAPPRRPTGELRVRWSPQLGVRAGLVGWGCVVLALWWHDTDAATLHGAGLVMTALGQVSGLLAAYLVLVQLVLMARIPAFEQAVGFDRLTAWHRGLGTNVVLLIVLHVLLTVWGYGLTDHHQPLSELVTVVTSYPDMWKATIGTLLFLAVGIVSARTLRPHVSYEAWYLLHLTAYLAVVLVYFHQTSNGGDFVAHPLNRTVWLVMYLAVAACLVVWRVVLPAAAVLRHRMTVERVVEEAPGVVSVWIRGRDLDRLGARAGQFLLWRFGMRGHLLSAHPYSLSAPPLPDRLRITVRDAGDHSRAIARLRPGTLALAEGPFGHFTAAHARRRKALLLGAGSGIGPVRALAEDLADRGDDVVVVQRASTADDLALRPELDLMAHQGRLVVHYVIGSRRELGHDPLAARFLRLAVPDITEREAFICGPPGLTHAMVRTLRDLGLSAAQMHTEEFELL